MSDYKILSWQNETGLTNYPLTLPFDIQNLIVDASFIQFDNYVPELKLIVVNSQSIDITITFDIGDVSESITTTDYQNGRRHIRFIDSGRYLGCLTIGEGASGAWVTSLGRRIAKSIPFSQNTVRSIPSRDAVYSLDNKYGDVLFGALSDIEDTFTEIGGIIYKTQAGGNTMFYNRSVELNSITFNAVGNHRIPDNAVELRALKKINMVPPRDNNIYIESNDVIKFNAINDQNLQITLVGESSGASIVPTLTT
jgi:hypothetical protein